MSVQAVVSGGQTGTDRGALIAAAILGIPHGGWCPKGRKAEDGVIPAEFPVRECDSEDYTVRTRLNVSETEGTLVFSYERNPTGGTKLTLDIAHELGRPTLLVTLAPGYDEARDCTTAKVIRQWIAREKIAYLNVAGPRESKAPGIKDHVAHVLLRAWQTKDRCVCGRAIPPEVLQLPAVRSSGSLKCRSCGHVTILADLDGSTTIPT